MNGGAAKQWERIFTSGNKWNSCATKRKASSGRRDFRALDSPLEQMYLDFGQRSFGRQITCAQCGMRYAEGEPTDEEDHRKYHRRTLAGVFLRGASLERNVRLFVHALVATAL